MATALGAIQDQQRRNPFSCKTSNRSFAGKIPKDAYISYGPNPERVPQDHQDQTLVADGMADNIPQCQMTLMPNDNTEDAPTINMRPYS